MRRSLGFVIIFIVMLFSVTSCVMQKKHAEVVAKSAEYEAVSKQQKEHITVLEAKVNVLDMTNIKLAQDTLRTAQQLRLLQDKYSRIIEEGSNQSAKIMRQFNNNKKELTDRSRYISELEMKFKMREDAIRDVRAKMAGVLVRFFDEGVSVVKKESRVSVNIPDSLLFESGGIVVSERGKEIITDIAAFVAKNPSLDVLVVGFASFSDEAKVGTEMDNWDLSVRFAAEVVRLMLKNENVNARSVVAAGNGVILDALNSDTTHNGRGRVDIILSPKLNDIYELMEATYSLGGKRGTVNY